MFDRSICTKAIKLSFHVFIVFVITAVHSGLYAQQARVNLDWNPFENTENLVPNYAQVNSPQVNDDRTVTFRLLAPGAHEVSLSGYSLLPAMGVDSQSIPFTKDAEGLWTLTVGPVPQDIYVYHFVVDGVTVVDPNNTYVGSSDQPGYSELIVHGDGPAYYDAKDVPHGAVTRHIYHSDVTKGEREMYVYTPPNYDASKQYPVLYLVGGSGELASSWSTDGRVNFMMDNLLAEGKAVPMIIAMPNNQLLHRRHPQHVQLTFDLFEKELREQVIPFVESHYSVKQDRRARALSGLSMGGRHTQIVGFRNLDLFASFGVLSSGDVNTESVSSDFLNTPDINAQVDYLFVGQGAREADRPNNRTVALVESLKKHGIEHEYYVGGGGHDWTTWRHLLYFRFLPGLWQNLD